MSNLINPETLSAVESANRKYKAALASKMGIQQTKQFLANLLVGNADTFISLAAENDRLNQALLDIEDENDALTNAMIEKHKENAELKAALEEKP